MNCGAVIFARSSRMTCALMPNLNVYSLPPASKVTSPLTGFDMSRLLLVGPSELGNGSRRRRRADGHGRRASHLERARRRHPVLDRGGGLVALHVGRELPHRVVRPDEPPPAHRARRL